VISLLFVGYVTKIASDFFDGKYIYGSLLIGLVTSKICLKIHAFSYPKLLRNSMEMERNQRH